jgi:hypothetical protein
LYEGRFAYSCNIALYRLDICNEPILFAQTAITSALYEKIFGLKVNSHSYYVRKQKEIGEREDAVHSSACQKQLG